MLRTVSGSISGDEFGLNFIEEWHHLIKYVTLESLECECENVNVLS